jgi:hypothetical protein
MARAREILKVRYSDNLTLYLPEGKMAGKKRKAEE